MTLQFLVGNERRSKFALGVICCLPIQITASPLVRSAGLIWSLGCLSSRVARFCLHICMPNRPKKRWKQWIKHISPYFGNVTQNHVEISKEFLLVGCLTLTENPQCDSPNLAEMRLKLAPTWQTCSLETCCFFFPYTTPTSCPSLTFKRRRTGDASDFVWEPPHTTFTLGRGEGSPKSRCRSKGGFVDLKVQGWAKEWSLGLQFFSSCVLRHRLSAGCVATELNKKSPNLGTTL